MTSHWFSVSQWQLPNEDDYRKLHALLAQPDRAISNRSLVRIQYNAP